MSKTADVEAGSRFLGTWRNTNPSSTGMAELTFTAGEGGLALRVGGDARADRFEAQAEVFVDADAATEPEKIMADQDLGSMSILLHGWVKQGVLVLAIFRRFKDEGGRSNYFDREFFYRAEGLR